MRALADLRETLPAVQPEVVLNRVRVSAGPAADALAALRRFTGIDGATVLPEDRAATDAAWSRGVGLSVAAPRADLRSRIATLASTLVPAPVPRLTPTRRTRRRARARCPAIRVTIDGMTDRLSPADAGFLYTEDVTTPMHVGGVAILRPDAALRLHRHRRAHRGPAVAGAAVPAEGALRPRPLRPAGVGGRRGLRPDVSRPAVGPAQARLRCAAGRPGRTAHLAPAGPLAAAVGGLRGGGPVGRPGGADQQDPPGDGRPDGCRRHRRGHPGPVARAPPGGPDHLAADPGAQRHRPRRGRRRRHHRPTGRGGGRGPARRPGRAGHRRRRTTHAGRDVAHRPAGGPAGTALDAQRAGVRCPAVRPGVPGARSAQTHPGRARRHHQRHHPDPDRRCAAFIPGFPG